MAYTISKEVLCMDVNNFRNFTLFFEDIEGFVESKCVFGNQIIQNITLFIKGHVINMLKNATYIPCNILVTFPFIHSNQLLNGT
jgi:hypothetical protein